MSPHAEHGGAALDHGTRAKMGYHKGEGDRRGSLNKTRRKAKGGCHAQAEGAGMCPHTQSMAALRLTMAPCAKMGYHKGTKTRRKEKKMVKMAGGRAYPRGRV